MGFLGVFFYVDRCIRSLLMCGRLYESCHEGQSCDLMGTGGGEESSALSAQPAGTQRVRLSDGISSPHTVEGDKGPPPALLPGHRNQLSQRKGLVFFFTTLRSRSGTHGARSVLSLCETSAHVLCTCPCRCTLSSQ